MLSNPPPAEFALRSAAFFFLSSFFFLRFFSFLNEKQFI